MPSNDADLVGGWAGLEFFADCGEATHDEAVATLSCRGGKTFLPWVCKMCHRTVP